MKLTIVTICYNESKNINRTIESVLKQDYLTDVDHLIIDGASTDNTIDIVNSFKNKYENIGLELNVISEKDKGIYDAYNKGIDKAKGDWIIYLNGGDYFYLDNVISLINKNYKDFPNYDFYYSDFIATNNHKIGVVSNRIAFEIKNLKTDKFILGALGVFNRKSVLKELYFDEKYKISADTDLNLRALVKGYKFKYLSNLLFCVFDTNGISSNPKTINEQIKQLEDITNNLNIEIDIRDIYENSRNVKVYKKIIRKIDSLFCLNVEFILRKYILKRKIIKL